MTPEQPRTYKHQLTAEEFTFAFTATEVEFAARADEMREKGVERLTGAEIYEKYIAPIEFRQDKKVFTLIEEAEIIAKPKRRSELQHILLQGIDVPVPGIVFWRSTLPSIRFASCTLAMLETGVIQDGATSFHFFESMIDDFSVEQSTTGSFSIERCTMGDFNIWDRSTMDKFSIKQSMMGDFNIWDQSTTGDFHIREQSMIGAFNVFEQSTIGNFYVWNSTAGDFIISQSAMGNFSVARSMIGEFLAAQSTTGYLLIRDYSTAGNLCPYPVL